MMPDLSPLWLSLKLASITTGLLFVLGIPLAYWLAQSRFRFKSVIETTVSLPLVLPPSVIGFYLLVAFSPAHLIGGFFQKYLGLHLAFSFEGLVVASVIYGLPFMINPLSSGFMQLPASLVEASKTLGKSRWKTLLFVQLPNMKPSLVTGLVISFAHCIGEFGVVLMIGGNIPGKTRLASLAIYDEVEAMHYASANTYATILFIASFVLLLTFSRFMKQNKP